MATSTYQLFMNPLYSFLDPGNISYRTQVPLQAAQDVLRIIFNRVNALGHTVTAVTDPGRIQGTLGIFRNVVNSINVRQLHVDTGVDESHVCSILNLVTIAVTIFLGPYDCGAGQQSNVWATLATPLNTMYVGNQKWPLGVQEHANALRDACTALFQNRKMLAPSTMVAVPLRDLDTLQREMGTLAQKFSGIYRRLGENARATQAAMPPVVSTLPTYETATNESRVPLRIMGPPETANNVR
jgi:hypothetical protein